MKFYLIFLLTAFSLSNVSGQRETSRDADSLLRAIAQEKTDTGRILSKCRLSEAWRGNKPDTSFILATEALSESVKIKFSAGQVHSLVALCVLHREKGDLAAALNAGLRALKISGEQHYHYGEIYSLVRIANIYLVVKDSRKAITYLRQADELLKQSPDDFMWSATHFFLGDAYDQLNEPDSALRQIELVEQRLGKIPLWIIVTKRSRGNIAVKRNELQQAAGYYRESISMAISEESYRDAATASNSLAVVFKKLQQPDSAIFYAKEGLKYGQMLSYKNRVLAAGSLLAELYAETDPKEAVKYFRIASAAKDSLYGVEKVQQLQTATIKEQERQTEMEAARVAYQNRVRQYTFLAGAVVFLVIAVLLYRNNRQKQKTNRVLETTLTNLKNTQSQLIQSEKMASLGELTAGIAHEIQNPLNFVNNFSELNKELLAEMNDELVKGNYQEAGTIAKDVMDNQEKINHHGKRADAIVKGMLQHSKSSTGAKEPTDINALADEYLRLAYHGHRAKDNSFNATLKTDYDTSIGKINIAPQDIGRVLVNLISNAFYACTDLSRSAASLPSPENIGINSGRVKDPNHKHEPTVWVSTKKLNGKIEVRIKDNGPGIPQNISDKIFQPFFTTKPTGQGTGLGLSLAYDIVKAHGGEIKVETKEGQGTDFIIHMPILS